MSCDGRARGAISALAFIANNITPKQWEKMTEKIELIRGVVLDSDEELRGIKLRADEMRDRVRSIETGTVTNGRLEYTVLAVPSEEILKLIDYILNGHEGEKQ